MKTAYGVIWKISMRNRKQMRDYITRGLGSAKDVNICMSVCAGFADATWKCGRHIKAENVQM